MESDLSVCHVDGKSSSGSFSLEFVWCFHAQLYNIWVARLTPNLVRSQGASAKAATWGFNPTVLDFTSLAALKRNGGEQGELAQFILREWVLGESAFGL